MKIALGQVNLVIGDLKGNFNNIKNFTEQAIEQKAELIVFPELSTTVKGAKDLLFEEEYISGAEDFLTGLLPLSMNIAIVIGGIQKKETGLVNTAFLLKDGKIKPVAKLCKPGYKEKKYFVGEELNEIFEINGEKFIAALGNDKLHKHNAEYTIRLNSTPFIKQTDGKKPQPEKKTKTIYINHVGLAQESVYNGGSFSANESGLVTAQAPYLIPNLTILSDDKEAAPIEFARYGNEEEIFNTLSFAFKEFCRINKFEKAVLGLSGGIDSALTAAIACDAIGPENVLGITMPSKYSTEGSWKDSYDLAKNLDMKCITIPIKPLFDTFINEIQKESYMDLAEENLQARLRANILMSFSNRENRILISTGNKSEAAMGYCTLYGDTAGGINLIADLYKQEVYALSRWINRNREVIPENIITKVPSAELRPNQKDQDSLPDYAILDDILRRYIEDDQSIDEISTHHDRKLVAEVINKLNLMEYKRNQFTYSLKISKKSLLDRDFPLINAFRVK